MTNSTPNIGDLWRLRKHWHKGLTVSDENEHGLVAQKVLLGDIAMVCAVGRDGIPQLLHLRSGGKVRWPMPALTIHWEKVDA